MELMTQDEFNQALADIVKLVYDRGIQQNPFTTREFTQIWNGMGAAYAAALAHIATLEAERRWIPVSERLPEKTEYVLVYEDGAVDCMAYDDKTEWFEDWVGTQMPNVVRDLITHWAHIELPSPE